MKLPELKDIKKHVFLYLWFCGSVAKNTQVNMQRYKWFDTPELELSRLSYRTFTQCFVTPVVSETREHLCYEASFSCRIVHAFPASLRRILDILPLYSRDDVVLLREGKLLSIKRCPKLMEKQGDDAALSGLLVPESLLYKGSSISITCNVATTRIEASNESQYIAARDRLSTQLESIGGVKDESKLHVFTAASSELNFDQAVDWLRRSGCRHKVNAEYRNAVTEDAIPDSRCNFTEVVLNTQRCYDNGEYEVFRTKGSRVLRVEVCSRQSRGELQQHVQSIIGSFNKGITSTMPISVDPQLTNIGRLRANDSVLFDSAYCRKAPPRVQPLLITAKDVESVLSSGRMVLVYQGSYYTTSDPSRSQGYNYLGMINRFGDYDPTKPYVPMLRTYKTNHLLSTSFKEFKAYLLRNSPNPHVGVISPEDLLLPSSMSHLYNSPLYNPDIALLSIHSKKTMVSKALKVQTAEVPDYVKTLLGTTTARRQIAAWMGTGLLEACGVDREVLQIAALKKQWVDLMGVDASSIVAMINKGELNHRLYGKCIEEITDYSVVVFDSEGIVPYRHSTYGKKRYVLLYQSPSGCYDTITTDPRVQKDVATRLDKLCDMCNGLDRVPVVGRARAYRPVDTTEVALRVVSWITLWCNNNDVSVECIVVTEEECRHLVSELYDHIRLPYMGCIRAGYNSFEPTLVLSRRGLLKAVMNRWWLASLFRPLISSHDAKRLKLYSPVDMNQWHPWRYSLEDTLYFNTDCYGLSDSEELCTIAVPSTE